MDPSPIGVSLLTRFAQGANKDLVCKYVRYLSPLQIVTDLRSDPEDPAQWEPGQMGRVHRESWLEHRRWVLGILKTCRTPPTRNARGKRIAGFSMDELLVAAALLNYIDLIDELIAIGVSDSFASICWNVLYGPFRNMLSYDIKVIVQVVQQLIHNSIFPPLRVLFDKYGSQMIKDRTRIIRNAIGKTSLEILQFLIQRMGKPAKGQTLIEDAVRDASADVMRYMITLYPIQDVDRLLEMVFVSNSLEKYLAVPPQMRRDTREHVRIAFSTAAYEILQYLSPTIQSFEWLNDALNSNYIVNRQDVMKTAKIIMVHPLFDHRRDLDLTRLQPRNDGSLWRLWAFLSQKIILDTVTRDELEKLFEIWKYDARALHFLQRASNFKFRRPSLEGEPPTKMIKDFANFYI